MERGMLFRGIPTVGSNFLYGEVLECTKKEKKRASKMDQWVKQLAAKPDSLRSIPGTQQWERRIHSTDLSSELHTLQLALSVLTHVHSWKQILKEKGRRAPAFAFVLLDSGHDGSSCSKLFSCQLPSPWQTVFMKPKVNSSPLSYLLQVFYHSNGKSEEYIFFLENFKK